ncbi:MAG: hypothetical protein MZV65_31575 [Chromatiales bacterium]|nr:hypothetical protein [Chromatiales bacterium]
MSACDMWSSSSAQSYVDLFIHNGVGSTSEALTTLVSDIIEGNSNPCTGESTPGWRAAGVEVQVQAMRDVPLHVQVGTRLDLWL